MVLGLRQDGGHGSALHDAVGVGSDPARGLEGALGTESARSKMVLIRELARSQASWILRMTFAARIPAVRRMPCAWSLCVS